MPHIRIDNQPVTQIAVIESEPGKQAEALSVMNERARFMAPGFIYIGLHRSLDGRRIVNHIQWAESRSSSRLIDRRNSARSRVISISYRRDRSTSVRSSPYRGEQSVSCRSHLSPGRGK